MPEEQIIHGRFDLMCRKTKRKSALLSKSSSKFADLFDSFLKRCGLLYNLSPNAIAMIKDKECLQIINVCAVIGV